MTNIRTLGANNVRTTDNGNIRVLSESTIHKEIMLFTESITQTRLFTLAIAQKVQFT